MKKIYILATALCLGANINAQLVVDFESITLTPESYDNGSAGNGDFVFGTGPTASLTNVYDVNWSSWNGFSISNMTDVVTAGWGNQYSSFNGSGSNGSDNFGVFYPAGTIETSNGTEIITSFKITNTTYSGVSMRDGDGFAKQFGSLLDASGVDDGTNGEDFLKIWIIGENFSGTQKDSIEFFLADYRFADNNLDYIVDQWEVIDVDALGFNVSKISFRFESSDNGQFGINTPTYFAIDDIAVNSVQGIEEQTKLIVSVYPNPVGNILNINGEEGVLTLYDVKGNTLYNETHKQYSEINMSSFANGVYYIRLENNQGVAVQKVIK